MEALVAVADSAAEVEASEDSAEECLVAAAPVEAGKEKFNGSRF